MIELKALEDIYRTMKEFITIAPRYIGNDDLGVDQSKFGGTPYFPRRMIYPRTSSGTPLQLLAQINLVDLPQQSQLPVEGILQFYIDPTRGEYGINDDDTDGFKVVYIPYTVDYTDHQPLPLLPAIEPGDFPFEGIYRLSFQRDMFPLPEGHPLFEEKFSVYLENDVSYYETHKKDREPLFYDLYSDLIKPVPDFYMGGYPSDIQGLPDFLPENLEETHTLLLQMGSQNGIGFGDGGNAYFLIPKEDLARLDFSRVIYFWDCG